MFWRSIIVGVLAEVHKSEVLAVYSTFPALLETLFATFDVDRNGRIDLEARDMGG